MVTYHTTGPYITRAGGRSRETLAGVPAFRLKLAGKRTSDALDALMEHNEAAREVGKEHSAEIHEILAGRTMSHPALTQAERDDIARLQRSASAAERQHAAEGMRLARAYQETLGGTDAGKVRRAAAKRLLEQDARAKQAYADLREALEERNVAFEYAGRPGEHQYAQRTGTDVGHWTSALSMLTTFVNTALDLDAAQAVANGETQDEEGDK
ncbi:hypothetical protein GCG21_09740 [Pseudactinotalea sp. HY160]|uniref:hypothetical protein n=1 Tax=Pseudactinotalea sp. HY160 TaxID=2654490 RepID=UPI00128CEFD7|nr:hypothetical protein [Pseudactinotalea sp. HY160]MPV50279.1 hypothetical protein [Pseudactinotalea sp. HY160]